MRIFTPLSVGLHRCFRDEPVRYRASFEGTKSGATTGTRSPLARLPSGFIAIYDLVAWTTGGGSPRYSQGPLTICPVSQQEGWSVARITESFFAKWKQRLDLHQHSCPYEGPAQLFELRCHKLRETVEALSLLSASVADCSPLSYRN